MESSRELSGNTSYYYNVKAVARRKSSVVIFYTQFTIAPCSRYLNSLQVRNVIAKHVKTTGVSQA